MRLRRAAEGTKFGSKGVEGNFTRRPGKLKGEKKHWKEGRLGGEPRWEGAGGETRRRRTRKTLGGRGISKKFEKI